MHLSLLRRNLLIAGLAASATPVGWAAPVAIPASASLPDELAAALKTGNPLVVLVSLDGCPFCKIARENYLAPLREREGLPVVQVDMRSKQILKDFRGSSLTHDEWIRARNVKVAPTVLFFGRGGDEIVERMTGGYIPDFYGTYLDERLKSARALLRK
jgi:thioredoxin-related protein